jgi:hypothetical protein
MSFEVVALILAAAGCILGLRFTFAAGSVLKEWGVEATAGAQMLFRRMGAIYLGVALMFFLGRSAPPSDIRSAVCLVTAGVAALLASLGFAEYRARRAGVGILRSVVAEAALSVILVWTWWAER